MVTMCSHTSYTGGIISLAHLMLKKIISPSLPSPAQKCIRRMSSQPRADRGHRFGRRDYRNDFELDQIFPPGHPFGEEILILALHDLEAAAEIVGDPTRHIPQSLGRHSALFAKATMPTPVNRYALAEGGLTTTSPAAAAESL